MNGQTPAAPQLGRRILSPATLISFGVGVLLAAFLLTRFDVDLSATWTRLRGADPLLYGLAFLAYYATFLLRGYRWRLLLGNAHPAGTPRPLPSPRTLGTIIYLGWFVNTISWFRMGDAYISYLVASRERLSVSRTVGSMVASRVLDVVVMVALLGATALLLWSARTPTTTYLLAAALGLVLAALLGLVGMALLGGRLQGRLPRPLAQVYQNFHEGTLLSFRKLPLLLTLTGTAWLQEAVRLYLVATALGLEASVALLLFAGLAGSLLTTTPITPGGVGIVETGMTGILMQAMTQGDALSITLLDRSITYLSIILFGGVLFLVRQALQRRAPRQESSPAPQGAPAPSQDKDALP